MRSATGPARAVLPAIVVLVALASCSSDGIRLPERSTVPSTVPATDPATVPSTAPATVPGTEPPVSEPAATAPPSSGPAVSDPDPTDPTDPATTVPVTSAPATTAPATAPATTAPAPTAPVTAPPSTAVPGTDVTVPVEGEDDDATWWPWVAVGVLLLVLVGLLLGRRRGPSWDERVTATLDEVDALSRRLAALPAGGLPVPGVADDEAASLARLRATLVSLVRDAPDERRRIALSDLGEPLAALHLAVGSAALAAPAPGAPLPPPSSEPTVAQRAVVVHTASATVRAAVLPPSAGA